MAITLTGSGGIFTRLGKAGYVQVVADAFFAGASADDLPEELEDFMQEIDGASTSVMIRESIDQLADALTTIQGSNSKFNTTLHASMSRLLIEQVNQDDPLQESKTTADALEKLIDQMGTLSQTVDGNQPSIAAISAYGANQGTTIVLQSILNGQGMPLENIYDEDIELAITDTTNANNELFSIRGEDAVARTSPHWPKGSGANTGGTVINPNKDGELTNGGFNGFTVADTPDSWDIDTGTASTTIKEQTTTVYMGTSCLEFDGDGAELTAISQELTDVDGVTSLKANGQYAVHFAARLDVSAASGTLVIDLWDPDAAAVIADDQSVDNSISVALTSLSTSDWTTTMAIFRLPGSLPHSIQVRVRMSAAVPSGSSLYIDAVCINELTEAYASGPAYALIATDERAGPNDRWKSAITNDYRGAIQTMFWRVFGHPELPLPSNIAGGESINDNLIV